jgi:hypothetical protein
MRALKVHEITFDMRVRAGAFWAALLERGIRPGDMPKDDLVLVVTTLNPAGPGLHDRRCPAGSESGRSGRRHTMLDDERLPVEWAQLRRVAARGAGEHGWDPGNQNGWRKCSLMISPSRSARFCSL